MWRRKAVKKAEQAGSVKKEGSDRGTTGSIRAPPPQPLKKQRVKISNA
jgi:hypothetical protein